MPKSEPDRNSQAPESNLRFVVVALLLTALVACAYHGAHRNGFVYDDVWLVENDPRIQSPDGILEIWRTEYWNDAERPSRVYRPLTLTTFALERHLLGPEPGHFHGVNLALHLVVVLLFASLSFRWLGDRYDAGPRLFGAATAAGLFAVGPVHSEAVLGIVGRSELLAGLFVLIALWGLARGPRGWILAAFAAAGAVLSKESGFLVLPLAVLWVLVGQPGRPAGAAPGRAWSPLVLLLGIGPASWIRHRVLADIPVPTFDFADNPLASAEIFERIVNASALFWKYLALHLRPDLLSPDHSYAAIQVEAWSSPTPLVSFVLLAGLILYALARLAAQIRARSEAAAPDLIGFGLLWYLGGMVAAGNFLMVIGTVFGERLTYLPGMGLFLLVGCGVAELSAPARSRLRIAVTAAAVIAGIGVGVVATQARTRAWSSSLTLSADATRAQPASFRTWAMYGTALHAEGRLEEAQRAMNRSLEIYDRFPQTWSDQTAMFYNSAQFDQAAEAARRLRELAPDHVIAYLAIAEWALRSGDLALADAESAAGENAHPQIAHTAEVRGRILAAAGRHREAAAAFERSLALLPSNEPALRGRASAWREAQAWPEAEAAFAELYAFEPSWETANSLAWCLLKVDRLDEALELSQVAIGGAPEIHRHYALDTRAEILWSLGRKQEAIEIWRPLLRDHPAEYSDKVDRVPRSTR